MKKLMFLVGLFCQTFTLWQRRLNLTVKGANWLILILVALILNKVWNLIQKLPLTIMMSPFIMGFPFPVPMVFLAAQLKPINIFAVEAEVRGISYDENQVYSLIGRLKVKVFGPLFAAGGYRYDKIKFDTEDVEADITLSGPFIEAGFAF